MALSAIRFARIFRLIGNVEMRFDPELKNALCIEPVSIEPRVYWYHV